MSNAYRSIDPATGKLNAEYPLDTDERIEEVIVASGSTGWGSLDISERAAIVSKVADLFHERAEELGAIITREMGKPAAEARGEAEFSGDIFRYYADNGPEFAKDLVLEDTDEAHTVIKRLPIGALLGVMPWNYPYYQVARFAAPNLMLGNTIILKHAESVPESALAIQQIMDDAGVPAGVYQNVFADHDQISTIISDPRIQGVSFTGSERGGEAIGAQAGKNLKKAVLELGGSDPYVILSTDDVRAAARDALAIRLENTGQACNSNKRIIVSEEIYEDFVNEAVARIKEIVPGNPAEDKDNTFGPLSSEAAADNIVAQLAKALKAGATLHVGGDRVGGEFEGGFYVAPAVLTDVPVGSEIYYQEFFGPVVQIYSASSDEEALKIANDTQYGLGSAVFATEPGRAEKFAEGLEAGMTGVNQPAPETEAMPFGGVKRSGFGRELGPLGMDEFVNKKLFSVKKK